MKLWHIIKYPKCGKLTNGKIQVNTFIKNSVKFKLKKITFTYYKINHGNLILSGLKAHQKTT